ncbi:MAG: dTDP-4-amino-4,6-dideoxygalactose transaminase [Bacteroidales bacterium]
MIPFNKPHITGKEVHYIYDAVASGHISGNGKYTKMCQQYFEERYGFKKALLTTSCTDALEMCAILLEIKPGDEVIIPSYTFVSTALAFHREGAEIIFADSRSDHPGIDEDKIEELITPRTKAIVVVHYAGVACDMDKVMDIARRHGLFVVEDAAHATDSYYTGNDGIKKPLGSIGHLAAFSFHETKNIQCGEGGLLAINDERFIKRSEIIWEKGTNRAEFFRGEVNKYGWVDTGSSFLPSEVSAAFLWAQIEDLDEIQEKRKEIWEWYDHYSESWLKDFSFTKPHVPAYATNNAHMYYIVCNGPDERIRLINHLKSNGILAVFHYLSLHKSPFYSLKHDGRELPNCDRFADCLVRLPMFYELNINDVINKTRA